MSWNTARKVAQLTQEDNLTEIQKTLKSYHFEQRRCITSIKYKRSSLLFIAIVNYRLSIAIFFLESCGADPDSFGYMGGNKLSCLSAATCIGLETIVKALLNHGAKTELASSAYQTTALLYACSHNRRQIATCLIENGANVNGQNGIGESCLIESVNDIELFKYLISMGADVNSVGACGQTVLMLAIESQRDEIVSFLLGCEDTDVRLKNDSQEDAFYVALQYSSKHIIEEIIRKGGYTKEEMIEAYEFESCHFHVRKLDTNRSNELWEEALNLRAQSNEPRLFGNCLPSERLQKIVDLLNSDDIPTLLYLESIYGLNNVFTLQIYTRTARNVSDSDKYISLCEFFFDVLFSVKDRIFFGLYCQTEQLIQHFFAIRLSSNTYKILKLFNVFANYTRELRARFERMTPLERMPHAHMIECFLYFTTEYIELIYRVCSNEMHLFHDGIKTILNADLRGLRLKSLIQMCGRLHSPLKVMSLLFSCRANVNSTDIEGKTVLHELVESAMSDKKIVKLIVVYGFDFYRVKCEEYCLPCKMEREGMLLHPVEHVTLQCLAARIFCEKVLNGLSDIPYHLMATVYSHLYIP